MTYGPETVGGRVFQRFGPLIQDGGWRRLNVLLTRAKSAMYIYSSMNSSDVVSYENNRSKKALRDLLEYGEKGHLHHSVHTGKAPDSDFEIAVMRELAKAGYQCEPQLGVAGFFLDLAVRNPYKPTEFLLAIECDGATYHSAKSARDRDRLRQEILENLGWEIRRIWSTDWFSNSQRALAPILVRLQELSEQARLVAEKNVTKESLGEQTAFKFEPELIDELDKEPKANVEVVTTESNENIEEGTNETVPATLSIDTEIIEEEQTLEQALYQLAKEIERQCSVVPTGYKRLLRPAMIELLSLEMPLNKEEFQRYIPESYRRATNPEEGRFLDEVFALIKSYC